MNTASSDLTKHLLVLQERLLHPTDYEKAFHYFIEEFGGDVEFIQMGQTQPLPMLTPIIDRIACTALGKTVKVNRLKLTSVPGHAFHHGSASVDGRVVLVLFFESLNKGLMTIIPGARGAAESARFSLPAAVPMNPSAN